MEASKGDTASNVRGYLWPFPNSCWSGVMFTDVRCCLLECACVPVKYWPAGHTCMAGISQSMHLWQPSDRERSRARNSPSHSGSSVECGFIQTVRLRMIWTVSRAREESAPQAALHAIRETFRRLAAVLEPDVKTSQPRKT
jgi:hypothetical protein